MSNEASSAPASSNAPVRRIFQAAAVISVATFAVRLAGLVNSQAIAASFGVGDAVETYFLAGVLPTFAFGALGSTLPAALVPAVVGVRATGDEPRARALLRDLYAWSVGLLLVVTGLLALAWPFFSGIVGAGFDAAKRALATEVFHLLLPIVFLHGAATVWGAVLKAEKRFLPAALGPGAVPITIAFAVWGFAAEHGVYALAVGHVLGVFVEFVILALCLGPLAPGRSAVPAQRVPLLPRGLPRRSPDSKAFARQYLPAVGGGLLFASTQLVDQSMAARLEEGSLATLSYANVLVTALLSIGTTALGTAILPFLSDMVAERAFARMRASLLSATRLVLLLATPLALALAFLAVPLVGLLFERGAFEAADSAAVGGAFALYVLQLPFYTTEVLCSRVLSALSRNQLVFLGAFVNLVLNVCLNLVLVRSLGVAGIALATSVAHLCVAGLLWWLVAREMRRASADGPAGAGPRSVD